MLLHLKTSNPAFHFCAFSVKHPCGVIFSGCSDHLPGYFKRLPQYVMLIPHCNSVLVAPAKKPVQLGEMSFKILFIH